MQRERVTDDIYVFTSDLYAQVTAGVILTAAGAVVFDTLAYPTETLHIKQFIEDRLGTQVAYVINSHFHADHTTGTCFFEGVPIVAHKLCRDLLDSRGRSSLDQAKQTSSEMRSVEIALPNMVFSDGVLTLHIGGKTLDLWSSPGHSPDSITCLVREERVLFGADAMMPIPYFVDGSYDDFLHTLNALRERDDFDTVIQGHGEVVLPGEIPEKLQSDVDYLQNLSDAVDDALQSANPEAALRDIDIESCGKSRILLNGDVEALHMGNVQRLADERRNQT